MCDQIDQDMLDDIGYIRCTSCHVRHNGLLGHAHSHNLPKGQYPQYETRDWNIDIRCLDCHRSLDNYVFEDIQYFKDLDEIMKWREGFEPLAYNRFVAGLQEVGCDKYQFIKTNGGLKL